MTRRRVRNAGDASSVARKRREAVVGLHVAEATPAGVKRREPVGQHAVQRPDDRLPGRALDDRVDQRADHVVDAIEEQVLLGGSS